VHRGCVGAGERGDASVARRVVVDLVEREQVGRVVDPVGVLRQPADDGLDEERDVERERSLEKREGGGRLGRSLALQRTRGRLVLQVEQRLR
jgi:hypothetical protein